MPPVETGKAARVSGPVADIGGAGIETAAAVARSGLTREIDRLGPGVSPQQRHAARASLCALNLERVVTGGHIRIQTECRAPCREWPPCLYRGGGSGGRNIVE